MQRFRTPALATACAAFIAAQAATAVSAQPANARATKTAAAYTLDDWMTVDSVSSFTWSPDGAWIYYTSDAGELGTDQVFRIKSTGGAPEQVTHPTKGERPEPVGNLELSADGSTIYFTSSRYFQNIDNIFRVPAAGGAATALTFNDAIIETEPKISPDGKTLAYFSRGSRGTKIYLLDVTKQPAWPKLFDPGTKFERNPVWSPDGKLLAFTREGDTWVRPIAGGEAKRLAGAAFPGGHGSPAFSPDGLRVAVVNSISGYAQIGIVDIATGVVTPITYEAREHSAPAWSADGRWLTFIANDHLSRDIMIAPADGSAAPKSITTGKGIRTSPQFSPDGKSVAYIETTGDKTADIWVHAVAGGARTQMTKSMGKIDPALLSVPEDVSYKGPDNLAIPALLYKPKTFDPSKKYPVIVQLHGHPGQWNHAMNVTWQYFVQRGFVLIAINPRGTVGLGQGFHDLHVGDYGGTEYEDCMAVLDYLKTQPYIDMTRKATWGGSGGGYMSLTIATKSPGVFQAQVIRAPVSNWKWLAMERFGSPARFATPTRDPGPAREEFGGSYQDIPERYDERSPLNFVDKLAAPQLLLQGLRDSSVPPNESKRWAARVKELGKTELLEYVEYPDEDHSLTRYRATIRDIIQRADVFYTKHLRLGASASAAAAAAPPAAAVSR